MSLVGPRPDVPGFADRLAGDDRISCPCAPGSPAPPRSPTGTRRSCSRVALTDPEAYNRDVIWPAKVALNREYVEHWSLRADVTGSSPR